MREAVHGRSDRPLRVVYATFVDASVPNGPGVNEREFAHALTACIELEDPVVLLPHPQRELPEGQGSYFFYWTPRSPLFRWIVGQVSFALALRRVVRRARPDVVILRLDALPVGAALGLAFRRVPIACKSVGSGSYEALRSLPVIGRIAVWAQRWVMTRLLRRSVVLDTVTNELRMLAAGQYDVHPDRIVVIQNGVNTDRFAPNDRKRMRMEVGLERFDPLIGFAGGHPWDRGGRQIVHAVAELISDFPNIGAVVLGPLGTGHQDLVALAESLGVSARCCFPGVVDLAELPAFVAGFDVGISLDRPERAAAVGNSSQKLRQYIACGVPVVTSQGTNNFVEEEHLGTLVNPDDQAGVTEALRRWLSLSNTERAEHTERAAAYAAEHLSVSTLLATRIDLFRQRIPKTSAMGARSGETSIR